MIETILHAEGTLGSCRALGHANAATGTIIGEYLNAHLGTGFDFFAFPIAGGEGFWRTVEFFGQEGFDADGGV